MVGVEIHSWVKPQSELLLLATNAIAVDIGVEEVRLPWCIPQKLKVKLIVVKPIRRELHTTTRVIVKLPVVDIYCDESALLTDLVSDSSFYHIGLLQFWELQLNLGYGRQGNLHDS